MFEIGNLRIWRLAVVPALAGAFLFGCRQEAGRTPTKATAKAKLAKEQGADEAELPPNGSPQANPAAYFRALRNDLVSGHGEAIAAAIPQSYRKAIAKWGEQWMAIDRDTRVDFLESVARAAEIVAQKDELIGQSESLVFDGPWAGVLNTHLAGLARATAVLARWPGWQAKEKVDVSGMIRAAAAAIAAEPKLREAFQRIEFKSASDGSGTASVQYRTDATGPWRTITLKRVESTWVPTGLVVALENASRTKRDNGPSDARDLGQRLRRLSDQLDQFSDTLEGISTQTEFDELIQQVARQFLGQAPPREPGPDATKRRPVAEDEFVRVVVSGKFSANEKDQLLWQMAQHTDTPASTIATMREAEPAGSVVIRLGPVADLQTFAERLSGVTVENINEKKRTIKARINP